MKTAKQEIGELGENVACAYLKKRGFNVLCRNYRKKWGEIDIIARRGGDLYFVEVKTVSKKFRGKEDVSRGTLGDYRPEDNVHPLKIRRLSRAIETYLMEKEVPESQNWQLDLITVYLDMKTRRAHVEMLENLSI